MRKTMLVTVAALVSVGGFAQAAPFVARPLTLPRSDWRLDLGLGLGHVPEREAAPSATGLGLNLEAAYGLTSFIQLGLRTGVRMGAGGRNTQADSYGRMFETETYGVGGDDMANPEVSLKWALLYGRVAELGLDTRVFLPFEDGTRFGFMLGVPLRLRLGGQARIDTGVYIPVVLNDETWTAISLPLHVWFQLDGRSHLGVLTGVVIPDEGGKQVPLGVGFGYAASYNLDLKTWFLFRDLSGDGSANYFGLGGGIEVRL